MRPSVASCTAALEVLRSQGSVAMREHAVPVEILVPDSRTALHIS